jgi:putative DNA primase/helicase
MSAESAFLDAMRAAGLMPVKEQPQADGQLHRFRVEGDKPGSKNGFYRLYGGEIPWGFFGSWKVDGTHTWRATIDRPVSRAEQAEHRRQMAEANAARTAETQRMRETARAKAERLWALSRPAQEDHAYLLRKKIKAYGARQLNAMLVIPARDAAGTLHTLQFIGPDGGKRFLTGGRIQGCYCAIGKPAGTLLLAEGFATACTLYEATGHATACAFNAGNLAPVARALRAKFPDLRIVVCADNDAHTPGNPGLTHAYAAARAVHGWVAAPNFTGESND